VTVAPNGRSESIVSVRRIAEFLAAEELQEDARVVDEKPLRLNDEVWLLPVYTRPCMADAGILQALVIKDGEFCWNRDAPHAILEGVDLTLHKGELMGVWGSVGAGKVRRAWC
jgi:ATP-binding cassette subfamily C (CFTR/MRP) protein 1